MTPVAPTGTITVTSAPSEARVLIDDVKVGISPWSGTVANGVHTVKVVKVNYNDYTTTVTVEGDKTVTVTANLVPLQQTGSVSISSTPTGATVFFDGIFYGTTPVTATLSTGSHSVKVSNAGYNDYIATVSVIAGQTMPVYVTLVPGSIIITSTATNTQTQTTTTVQDSGTTGSLSLFSRPAGANVYIDGTFIGKAPSAMQSVSAGPHTALFTMNGYEDFSTIVQVTSGQTAEFTATMVPAGQRSTAGTQTTKTPGFGILLAVAGIAACIALKKR
jgi:hypothetical protein